MESSSVLPNPQPVTLFGNSDLHGHLSPVLDYYHCHMLDFYTNLGNNGLFSLIEHKSHIHLTEQGTLECSKRCHALEGLLY